MNQTVCVEGVIAGFLSRNVGCDAVEVFCMSESLSSDL